MGINQKLGTLANMAKARGLKLKLNNSDNLDWKTGAKNTLILVKNTSYPQHIVERCQSINYMEIRIKAFKIVL